MISAIENCLTAKSNRYQIASRNKFFMKLIANWEKQKKRFIIIMQYLFLFVVFVLFNSFDRSKCTLFNIYFVCSHWHTQCNTIDSALVIWTHNRFVLFVTGSYDYRNSNDKKIKWIRKYKKRKLEHDVFYHTQTRCKWDISDRF